MVRRNAAEATRSAQASDLQLQIARDVSDLIETGAIAVGERLGERDLALRFGVSRTPVRTALDLLVARGVLEKKPNRGFFAAPPATRPAAPEELPQGPTDALYERAARDWFTNAVPAQFSEREFQVRYGVGRLATNRTLMRLAENGVIARNRGNGWTFLPTLNTRDAHDQSYQYRLIMEPAAIRLDSFALEREAAAVIRQRHEAVLSLQLHELSLSELFALDADFHALIGRSCNNQFFRRAIDQQNAMRRLLEYASLIGSDRLIESSREHVAILARLEEDERDWAAELMAHHLRQSARYAPEFDISRAAS